MYRGLALVQRATAAPAHARALSAAAATKFEIRTVGVVGAGLMGAGIAQIAAAAGFAVVNIDSSAVALQRARDATRASLTALAGREVKQGKLAADAVAPRVEAALARITSGTDLGALAAADLVIEAVPEVRAAGVRARPPSRAPARSPACKDARWALPRPRASPPDRFVQTMDAKTPVFKKIAAVARPSCILATNTSGLSVAALARVAGRTDTFIGLHYFNPVPVSAEDAGFAPGGSCSRRRHVDARLTRGDATLRALVWPAGANHAGVAYPAPAHKHTHARSPRHLTHWRPR